MVNEGMPVSTEEYTSKILALTDGVLSDFQVGVFKHRTEWYLRQLPKWRAYSMARLGHRLKVIPDDWMAEFDKEITNTPGHSLRQIENPYTTTLKSEITIEEP